MTAAVKMPPLLFSLPAVHRSVVPLSLVNQLKQLSCTKRASDDINEHYFSRKSLKYWDKFYKHHENKFFKDRHYLEKDWGNYFSDDDGAISANGKVLLEVGFGAGNTIFPLIAAYPKLFIHACDFSTEALTLVKKNSNFDENRISAFRCDVTNEELCERISPNSVDVITLVSEMPMENHKLQLIFMLSAVSPNKMPFVIQNLKKVLKVICFSACESYHMLQPNGHILVRDYAVGDSSQIKLENRNQVISNNYYFRGDGTCSFYFSEDYLSNLFLEAGFCIVDMNTCCRRVENRSRNMTFHRRWIRAIFNEVGS